jgi:hypothetical protein
MILIGVTGDWDTQFVNQMFWGVDVQRILALPLPVHEMSDFIAWDPTKNGIFLVRSAYQVEWNAQFGHMIQTSVGSSAPDEKWNLLWSVQCPAKIRIFSIELFRVGQFLLCELRKRLGLGARGRVACYRQGRNNPVAHTDR